MAAVALPAALLLGILCELVSGLVSWPLGGDRAWWRGVSGLGTDVAGLARDRNGVGAVSLVEAGGAVASLLGAAIAAAGAIGVGPDGLVLLYLALALASAGGTVVGWDVRGREQSAVVVAFVELSFAVGLGTLFLRYGALDLEAVRGTQQILGTGLLLGPTMAAIGLVAAAKSVAWSAALRVPSFDPRAEAAEAGAAGPAVLLRLCRWSAAGATSLVAGVLLAGGALEPFAGALPVAPAAAGFAGVIGVARGVVRRVPDRWRLVVPGLALLLAVAGAAMVVRS